MKPYKGNSYDVTVEGGSRKIIVIRQMDPLVFSIAYQTTTSKIQMSQKKLENTCVMKGKEQ
jgi:hypothetical protein